MPRMVPTQKPQKQTPKMPSLPMAARYYRPTIPPAMGSISAQGQPVLGSPNATNTASQSPNMPDQSSWLNDAQSPTARPVNKSNIQDTNGQTSYNLPQFSSNNPNARENDNPLNLLSPADRIKNAVANSDVSALQNAFSFAKKTDLMKVAEDEPTVRKLFSLANIPLRNSILDNLYDGINKVDLLRDAIGFRFGVSVGSNKCSPVDADILRANAEKWLNKEQPWTLNGALHVYKTYLRLPQADLNWIRCLLTLDTNKTDKHGKPSVSGGTKGTSRVYFVNYNNSYTENVENGEFTDSNAKTMYGVEDTRKGLNLTDMVIAHELGHIVDANAQGERYSDRESFRKLNGWEEYPITNPLRVFRAIVESCLNPFMPSLTTSEKTIAEECGVRAIKGKAYTLNTLKDYITDTVMRRNYNGSKSNTDLIMNLWFSDALYLIPDLWFYKSPWKDREPLSHMKRQIHQGYENDNFFSYNTDALSGKISQYQFRDPGEDFAETYASFFVANPVGSKTPTKHREWFIQSGLDKTNKAGKYIANNGYTTNANATPRNTNRQS